MTQPPATISAIITNYQGRTLVLRCVASLLKGAYPVEIIVVDNGSTDGSVTALEQSFGDRVTTIILPNNPGPAAAWNKGIAVAHGDILLLLDNDTEVQAGTLERLADFFAADPTVGVAQCKLLRLAEPNQIDCVGEYLSPTGFLVHRAPYGTVDQGQYETADEIFAAKSAAMAVRRTAFQVAGVFDESYFQYAIETDFCWRVWLAGYRVAYCPGTKVLHQWGGSERLLSERQKLENISYQGTRNLLMTLIKNLGPWSLVRIVPLTVIIFIGLAFWRALYRDWWRARGILRGLRDTPRAIVPLWKRRQLIQQKRTVSDRDLFQAVMRSPSIFYFIGKASLPYRSMKRNATVSAKRI